MNRTLLFVLLFFCTFFTSAIYVFADDGERERRLQNLQLIEQETSLAVKEAKELSDEVLDLFTINIKYDIKTVNDYWDQIEAWILMYREFMKGRKMFHSDDFDFMDKLQGKINVKKEKILAQISDTLALLEIVDKDRDDYLAEKQKEVREILTKDYSW